MDKIEEVNGYLLQALEATLAIDDEDPDNPNQSLGEIEYIINSALDKLEQLKN